MAIQTLLPIWYANLLTARQVGAIILPSSQHMNHHLPAGVSYQPGKMELSFYHPASIWITIYQLVYPTSQASWSYHSTIQPAYESPSTSWCILPADIYASAGRFEALSTSGALMVEMWNLHCLPCKISFHPFLNACIPYPVSGIFFFSHNHQ